MLRSFVVFAALVLQAALAAGFSLGTAVTLKLQNGFHIAGVTR